jgi:hypothetical protein
VRLAARVSFQRERAKIKRFMLNAKRIFWLGVILFFGGFVIPPIVFLVAKRTGINAEAEEQLRNSLFFIGLLTATLGGIPLALVGIFLKARKIK